MSNPSPETDELVESCLPSVQRWVQSLSRRLPTSVERDDLYSDACMGVVQAAKSWKPNRGVPFVAYAHIRARGSMIDGLRRRRSHLHTCSLDALREGGFDPIAPMN